MARPSKDILGRVGPISVSTHVLTDCIGRLEAATSRLEDIASSSDLNLQNASHDGGDNVHIATAAAASSSEASSTPKPVETLPPSIQAFDTLLNTELKAWLDKSSKLGNVVDGQV